jgi:hypothetical protein
VSLESGDLRDRWALAIAERDRLRSALLDILVLVDPNDGVYRIADDALNAVTSELDEAVAGAEERDLLQAVVRAAIELLEKDRTSWSDYHTALDNALARLRWPKDGDAEEGT